MTNPTLDRLSAARVIATLRAPSADTAIRACQVLVDAGVTALEITYTTPDVPAILRALTAEFGGSVVLGAGTVLDRRSALEAAEAGAEFLVSPGIDDAVVAAMHEADVLSVAGAITPTEVMRALKLRVDVVKIFPGSLGGPDFLRALRGPFPDLRAIPTGGVSASNLAEWFAAGAIAVGAAGQLCPTDALVAEDWDRIGSTAKEFLAALP